MTIDEIKISVPADQKGQRLDAYLARQVQSEHISRSKIQTLLQQGNILVNGESKKAKYSISPGDEIIITIPPPVQTEIIPEEVSFQIIHEDDDLVVLSKPPRLVVHPACGHQEGTLVHGLLFRCRIDSGIGGELRPGIVHRLDKDTSGIMVVAKNDFTQQELVGQFKFRAVKKEYLAILDGIPGEQTGRVDLPIGRHPVHRKKMAVNTRNGRSAVTNWKVLESFKSGFCLVALGLETGRTHQIRVHMAACGHPVAGDPVYGKKNSATSKYGIQRQCLHAYILELQHPRSRELCHYEAPLYSDMLRVLELLRED